MPYSILRLAAFSRAIYWLTERNLPLLIALLFPGEADLKLEHGLNGLTAAQKPILFEKGSPGMASKAPGIVESQMIVDSSEKEAAVERRTRSFKVPIKNRNKLPDPVYQNGDSVWLTIDGEDGSFKVEIVTIGKWNQENQVWEYQVRQTDGKLYDSGALVGEGNLHRSKK